MDQPHDLLFDVIPHKFFFAITFRDISEEWQLGMKCFACDRVVPISMSRELFERYFWSGQLRHHHRRFRCTACGNNVGNRVTITGRVRRWRVLPSGRPLPGLFPLDPSPPRAPARLGFRGWSMIAGPATLPRARPAAWRDAASPRP